MAGKLPTIIDNQGEVTLRDAVAQIAASTKELDIATGFFEPGALPTPADANMTLKEFNQACEGTRSAEEDIRLATLPDRGLPLSVKPVLACWLEVA